MIQFDNTIDIGLDPDSVYAYLADLEHIPEWNRAIASTRQETPGPVTVGTRYRQVRSVPRPSVETLVVAALLPGRHLEVVGHVGPFEARLSYETRPSEGGTRLTNQVELQTPLPLGPAGTLLGGRIKQEVAANLVVLKRLLEAAPATG
jgi:hypothetical protein